MTNLLPCIEITTQESPTYTIIWLHGLGADGHDFVPIVPQLDLPAHLAIRFLFPHAPMQPITINQGQVMRAWYDISYFDDFTRQVDEKGVLRSQQAIHDLIAKENQRGIAAENILLAGFSQGGAIALLGGLSYPEKLRGILALSTYLPLSANIQISENDANQTTPIFMAHGQQDPIVPLDLGLAAKSYLINLGFHLSWHEYPMAHAVCFEEIQAISQWLQQQLAN